MKEIYIVGASGFGREVAWLIDELDEWSIKGFIDDNPSLLGEIINEIPVIGNSDFLLQTDEIANVCIAIGNPEVRQEIFNRLRANPNLRYPNVIARNVRIDKTIKMGIGNIICCHSILTVNIKLGNFNHINLDCTIGHDVEMNDYITVYPSVNISGNVKIGSCCEFGTGSQIIQGKRIVNNVVIGASATVVKDIKESGVYVGCPARRIK
ncbi:acetyltransferase [Traorella massiliensis]|uniref:acetyltransferase n=1 Tax=Traorella massiliensis TaxID=1903263 RepID=UPI00235251AB|nr:acetyltransferase [Traorella massiliensis]